MTIRTTENVTLGDSSRLVEAGRWNMLRVNPNTNGSMNWPVRIHPIDLAGEPQQTFLLYEPRPFRLPHNSRLFWVEPFSGGTFMFTRWDITIGTEDHDALAMGVGLGVDSDGKAASIPLWSQSSGMAPPRAVNAHVSNNVQVYSSPYSPLHVLGRYDQISEDPLDFPVRRVADPDFDGVIQTAPRSATQLYDVTSPNTVVHQTPIIDCSRFGNVVVQMQNGGSSSRSVGVIFYRDDGSSAYSGLQGATAAAGSWYNCCLHRAAVWTGSHNNMLPTRCVFELTAPGGTGNTRMTIWGYPI